MRRQSHNNRVYESTTKSLDQCSCQNYFMQKVGRILPRKKNNHLCVSRNKYKRGIFITTSKQQTSSNKQKGLDFQPDPFDNNIKSLSVDGSQGFEQRNHSKMLHDGSVRTHHPIQFTAHEEKVCEIAVRESNLQKGEMSGNKSSSNRTLLSTKYSRDQSRSDWMSSPHISKVEEEERKAITGFADIREVHTVVQGSMGTINEEMSDVVLDESIIQWRQNQNSPLLFF